MNGRSTLLGVLLALQLVIIAGVLLARSGVGESPPGAFLDFSVDAVDEVRIDGAEDGSGVTLHRDGDAWSLPSGLPADAGKLREVLDKLAALQSPWPVATTSGAAQRFEVSADKHQRHITLSAGGAPVADLFLGTSPGYQRVHARRADGDAVYSVALSNYQVPTGPDEWLDKTLLAADGEVTDVVRDDAWHLHKGDDGWQLDQALADQEAAGSLVERIADLRVTGPAPAALEGAPQVVFEVTDTRGPYRLSLYSDGEGKDFQVASDRREGRFALASYTADRLLVDRGTLEPSADAAPDTAAGGPTVDDGGDRTAAATPLPADAGPPG